MKFAVAHNGHQVATGVKDKSKEKVVHCPSVVCKPIPLQISSRKTKGSGGEEEEVVKAPNPQPERRKEGGIGDD